MWGAEFWDPTDSTGSGLYPKKGNDDEGNNEFLVNSLRWAVTMLSIVQSIVGNTIVPCGGC